MEMETGALITTWEYQVSVYLFTNGRMAPGLAKINYQILKNQ